MVDVRIYSPSKTAMQSGKSNSEKWVLEFLSTSRKKPNNLMGWTSSKDTFSQIKIRFASLEEAVSYANQHNLRYIVQKKQDSRVKPKNYADNFRFDRRGAWTH